MHQQFDSIVLYRPNLLNTILIPLASYTIQAGFPSPADDYLEQSININQELIKNPDSTFLAKVSGTSMVGDLDEGDILVVDRSIQPKNGQMAVCFVDGEFTVKRVRLKDNHCFLVPTNKDFPVLRVGEENDFVIWGVVTYVIKKV